MFFTVTEAARLLQVPENSMTSMIRSEERSSCLINDEFNHNNLRAWTAHLNSNLMRTIVACPATFSIAFPSFPVSTTSTTPPDCSIPGHIKSLSTFTNQFVDRCLIRTYMSAPKANILTHTTSFSAERGNNNFSALVPVLKAFSSEALLPGSDG
jgi:hypothetical protein